MLLKVLIVSAIVSIALTLMIRVFAHTLSVEERLYLSLSGEAPTRVVVVTVLSVLSWIATVVLAIITVVTW